jgi:hypothetical protein
LDGTFAVFFALNAAHRFLVASPVRLRAAALILRLFRATGPTGPTVEDVEVDAGPDTRPSAGWLLSIRRISATFVSISDF